MLRIYVYMYTVSERFQDYQNVLQYMCDICNARTCDRLNQLLAQRNGI